MATILDQYGKPLEQVILREQQTAKLAQLHHEYANHPSRGLTPAKLAGILQSAELGNLSAQAELFMDMEEKDAHLYAEMTKRKRSILTVEWEIKPPRNANAAEKSQAAYLTELVSDLPGWDNMLLDALDGIGHGFSCMELDWQMVGKEWLPKAMTHRPQSWFMTAFDDQNTIKLRDNTPTGAALTPFGWISHVHRARSGVLARSGLHRILAWPYLFKNYAVRDLAELLEIYGLPIRLGKYPPGTGEKEKATLLRAVTQLGHAAAGIIPESMSIDFETAAQGNHDLFQAMITWAEQSISKAILGGTLTSQADGKSSTHALGKVHERAQHDILASDAKQLAATLTRDLLYPLLVLNSGAGGDRIDDPRRMPQLHFDVREEEDFQMLAKALPDLVDIGTPVPISWVQRKLSIPSPQNNEPILVRTAPVNNNVSPVAANSLLAALKAVGHLSTVSAIITPEDPLNNALEDQAAAAWTDVLAHIQNMVAHANSLPELQNSLLTAYGSLPGTDLENILATAFAVAQLAGMDAVQNES
ncbi:DUF935 domain-containing protein [soil metagenome]